MVNLNTEVLVYNSITNNLDDEKRDLNSPFTFLEYLNYGDILTKEINELGEYQQYLKRWQSATNVSLTSISSDIRSQFITFLSEIKLSFTTSEEQRYFDNIDLNDNEQLSIAIPFFTTKIKEISLYFAEKREEISRNLDYVKTKGSGIGADRFIEQSIQSLYVGDDVPPGLTIPKDIGEFLKNIEIEVENQYDNFNDYYDLDPDKSPTFYDTISGNRFDFFTSNTNVISASYFVDTDATIRSIINEQGISLSEIPGLTVTYDTTDLSNLDKSAFVDYVNTDDRQDLKYLLNMELIEKYMGVDMFYLSSNNTGDYIYEKLFEADSPYRNLLNVNNPSTICTPGNNFVSERTVGGFYSPSQRGMLKMEANFSSTILPDEIKPDTVYIFPDPKKYGNISGVGASARVNPLIFSLDNSEFKNPSSSFGKSLVKSSSINQNFYSYNGIEQRRFQPNNLDPLRGLESLNLSGSLIKESGDIFGNKFFIFNNNNFVNKELSNFNISESPLNLNNTQISEMAVDIEKETIAAIRDKLKPVYVYNLVTDTIQPISLEFNNIFSRYAYNQSLYKELTGNTFADLNIFKNTFMFKTDSYFIVDNITYNNDGAFTAESFLSRVKPYNNKITTNQDEVSISNFSNPVNITDNILYIKVESDPSITNPTNLRFFDFSIYKYNLNTKREINLVSTQTQNQSFFSNNFTFDVGSNIVQIKDVKLNYNSKQNVLFCLTSFEDLNNSIFLHVLIFKLLGNELNIIQNYVINPNNFNTTQNFYAGNTLQDNFLTQSISSTPIQNSTYGTLTF